METTNFTQELTQELNVVSLPPIRDNLMGSLTCLKDRLTNRFHGADCFQINHPKWLATCHVVFAAIHLNTRPAINAFTTQHHPHTFGAQGRQLELHVFRGRGEWSHEPDILFCICACT